MQSEQQSDDLGFCPSFNCYSSDTPASAAVAAARISRQLQLEQTDQFHVDDDEFEFSFMIGDEEFSPDDIDFIDSDGRTVFPLFNRDLLISNDLDHETDRTTSLQNLFITNREIVQRKHEEEEEEIACTTSLEKLFITEREGIASPSSSESDESEGEAPAVFCVWRHKNDVGASPQCKKSRSTGSGSKRWRIRDLLRRSNSEGKEPMVMLSHKKVVEVSKRNLNSGDIAGKLKPSSPSVHEVFYVQQRAKREVVKRKSYLPYRQGLVGFFSNGNGHGNGKGKGKKLAF